MLPLFYCGFVMIELLHPKAHVNAMCGGTQPHISHNTQIIKWKYQGHFLIGVKSRSKARTVASNMKTIATIVTPRLSIGKANGPVACQRNNPQPPIGDNVPDVPSPKI